MPKAPTPAEIELAHYLAARDEFERRDLWYRNAKNNLSREYESMALTVFRKGRRFGWVRTDEEGEARFSETTFESEQDAMDDLAFYLGVGGW